MKWKPFLKEQRKKVLEQAGVKMANAKFASFKLQYTQERK